MNVIKKIKIPLFVIVAFILGIFLDRIFLDFPYLKLDPQVNVLDIANLIVTIVIAFMIPFFINKLIEEKRGLKTFIIDELKCLIEIISKVKTIINDAHTKGVFEAKDRDCIIYTFHEAELKVVSIKEQLNVIFEDDCDHICTNLTELLFTYKDYVTGGELMTSSFTTVNEHFYRENNTQHSKIETGLKKLIHEIYKF